MRLHELVSTSTAVGQTSGRLEKIALLAALLGRASADDIPIVIAFLSGSTRQGRIGVGGARLAAARPDRAADAPSLSLDEVDRAFHAIADASGRGSTGEKGRLLTELLQRATVDEQDFLMRLLFGELRQGALEGVLVEAVARAAGLPAAIVRRAAMMAGDLGVAASAAFTGGADALAVYAARVFRPIQPMLADSADSLNDALARTADPALEVKMDGARIQTHKKDDDVRVYSRALRDVTTAVPEVVEIVRAFTARELILDGEVITLRPDRSPQPFQITMRRFGRRLDVDRERRELPLTPFFFDCLYRDGRSLVDEARDRRFAALLEVMAAEFVIPNLGDVTPTSAAAFLADALGEGHEGVMVKSRGAPYAAGRRGQAWLKVKNARTLDLVVLAAEWGHGRRRGWLSNLHLGARTGGHRDFVMLGKTFKGLTDEMLAWQTKRLLELETRRDDYTVYVRPELVVEIAFNELQESPRYAGGLALRFARVKAYRPDKAAADADTFQTVQGIFQRMSGKEPPRHA